MPYSIVRTTQFFEFIDAALSWAADEKTVRLPADVTMSLVKSAEDSLGTERRDSVRE